MPAYRAIYATHVNISRANHLRVSTSPKNSASIQGNSKARESVRWFVLYRNELAINVQLSRD